jgi:hypothetical protein
MISKKLFVRAGTVLILLLLTLDQLCAYQYSSGYQKDNSDWWSNYAENSHPRDIKPQDRIPASSNLRILNVSLGSLDSAQSRDFSRVTAKLGNASVTTRGDASTGRTQICYSSAVGSPAIHLVFEEGEVDDSFYLFSGGPDWVGSNLCVSSKLISMSLSTASGLHLGQSRQEVEAILGKPSASEASKIKYVFEANERMKPDEIRKIRQQRPDAREEDFVFFLYVRIEAKFANSRLNYLAISKSETD